MSLCRLVYISEATGKFTHRDLTRLVEYCRARNEQRGITGLLLYSNGYFMQVLEGDAQCVPSLYAQISRDTRHHNIRQLLHQQVSQRLFPHWGMQLVGADHSQTLDQERLDKALLRIRLASDDHEAHAAIALMQEFRDQFVAASA